MMTQELRSLLFLWEVWLNAWHWPDPGLAVEGIWAVIQWMDLCLLSLLCHSTFQIDVKTIQLKMFLIRIHHWKVAFKHFFFWKAGMQKEFFHVPVHSPDTCNNRARAGPHLEQGTPPGSLTVLKCLSHHLLPPRECRKLDYKQRQELILWHSG